MIIDRDYIIKRVNQLIKEKQAEGSSLEKSYGLKQRLPKWISSRVFPLPKGLKRVISHPLNPVYVGYQQYKARAKKNVVSIAPLHGFATDFLQYYIENDFSFDTAQYYPEEDLQELTSFIDNRLRSVLAGCGCYTLSDKQLDMQKEVKALVASSRKIKGGYELNLDGHEYFLPNKYLFEEHTYIHDYGLKYLPESVKEYIAEKDFLDVGAFWGDTSILLARKYNPRHVYAYEPVTLNRNQQSFVIANNKLNDLITTIPKGVGNKEESIDIYVNPIFPSSSSTKEEFSSGVSSKETISVTTIDKDCADRTVGLVKIDIEGAEYSAIEGAIETIKRDKPVMLISLYHSGKDFFEIPPLLKKTVPEYSFRFFNLALADPFAEKILVAYPSNLT